MSEIVRRYGLLSKTVFIQSVFRDDTSDAVSPERLVLNQLLMAATDEQLEEIARWESKQYVSFTYDDLLGQLQRTRDRLNGLEG